MDMEATATPQYKPTTLPIGRRNDWKIQSKYRVTVDGTLIGYVASYVTSLSAPSWSAYDKTRKLVRTGFERRSDAATALTNSTN